VFILVASTAARLFAFSRSQLVGIAENEISNVRHESARHAGTKTFTETKPAQARRARSVERAAEARFSIRRKDRGRTSNFPGEYSCAGNSTPPAAPFQRRFMCAPGK